MPPKSRRPKPFAELVKEVAAHRGPTGSGWQTWPSPIGDKYWVDQQGSRWHMRGGLLTAREALTSQIEQFFAGAAPPVSDFAIAEFRDDQRRVLLVVQESC